MEIDCFGCGKCCYSKNPDEYDKNKLLNKRENTIFLDEPEVRLFWENFMSQLLIVSNIAVWEDSARLFITIRNFQKRIDGESVYACSFLDPKTKHCRIYRTSLFPGDCKRYPYWVINADKIPICEENRLEGVLTASQRTISNPEPKFVTLENVGLNGLLKRFGEESNTDALKDILLFYYGRPKTLSIKKKRKIQLLFDEINRDLNP